MQEINNLECLRSWFRECPLLQREKRFRADFIAENPVEYSIMQTPSTIEYVENVLGEMIPRDIQRLNYTFMCRDVYGSDVPQNLENAKLYQDIVLWIQEQTAERNFPKIAEGEVVSILPTLTPFFSDINPTSAIYQIQLQLVYKRH